MEKIDEFFKALYENFNQRKISDVVSQMADNDLLADEIVYHYFQLENDRIAKFEIGERI